MLSASIILTSTCSCPWVTGVGATKILPGNTIYDPESAANDPQTPSYPAFSSGGGFSNLHRAPDYQKAAIQTYFMKHDPGYRYYLANGSFGGYKPTGLNASFPTRGLYNRLGRGIPDVAALGDNLVITYQGGYGQVGGTSGSEWPLALLF